MTITAYNDANNIIIATLPDGTTTTESYPTGHLKKTHGSQTYPVEYTYDAQGRMKTMVTHGAAGDATTTWNYDTQRGWLISKVYADGKATSYTYTSAGRLHTRTWARKVDNQPLVTTDGYNSAGDLTLTEYSDNTPAVAITYNRLGQKLTSGNGVSATAHGYDANFRLTSEENTGVVARTLLRSYDSLGRFSGIAVLSGTTVEHQVAYAYDTAGRLGTVTQGSGSNAKTFSYSYLANSANLIASVTGPVLSGTQPIVSVVNAWESTRDVLASKENRSNGTTVSRYDYVANKLGQRVSVQHSGSAFAVNAFNLHGYDDKGQLTSTRRYTGGFLDAPEGPVADQQFGFTFDNIGNRLTATDGLTSGTYGINTVNQYTAIQTGTNAAVNPVYDEDGNQSNDGTLVNQWDGENRLVSITKPDGTVITCAYDAQSRRVRKTETSLTSVTSDTAFLYDGWNLVAEYDLTNLYGPTLTAANTWGIDLSDSPQGAGGVGGLLARNMSGQIYAYTYDGNGNVSELLDPTGVVAHYEYGPFGQPLSAGGTMAAQNPFRFSTKYTDDDTGLVYYGYRYYNPSAGRWISRDPITERGGLNLYGFVRNRPLDWFDMLGLDPVGDWISGKYWHAWWWQLRFWDKDTVQYRDDGAGNTMATRTKPSMDAYYESLAAEKIQSKLVTCVWKTFTVLPRDVTSQTTWVIPRSGGIDSSDAGFWLNRAQSVTTLGGTFDLRFNSVAGKYELRNTKGAFRWIDRIDSNSSSSDPLYFRLLETVNGVAEWITGADFPVNIDWEDNRATVRPAFRE